MKDSHAEKIESPAHQFDEIAFLYDELMHGVPYREWVAYLERLLQVHRKSPETVLDLCCGTGSASRLLADRGYVVSGVDISAEMVEVARERSVGLPIDYHVQDVSKLRLSRRFDLVVSLFDSLNYILDSTALQAAFYRVSEHLDPGALFIFDMNTEVAFAEGLFNQDNLGLRSPVQYNWRSSYDPASRICRVQMDFLYRGSKSVEVVHYQRAYDEEEVADMLVSAGMKPLVTYDAYKLKPSSKRSDRIFFVAEKE
ncbi:MAG: class I SAM-dependent DNA methyltransferase [Armatimonadota bacterium]